MDWTQTLTIAGVITAVVGVPLGIMVVYLRSIREDQNRIRLAHESLERRVGHVERDYTTKEEWLREAALTRRQLDKIENLLVGIQATGNTENGLAMQIGRLADALKEQVQT